MKKIHKWFTLVELVVVITILAILGTVALLSFRWYSWDARNSKRITDLNSIKNNVTQEITNGQNLLNFATWLLENQIPAVATPLIAGATPVLATNYQAGPINYPSIGMVAEDFFDPATQASYIIWVTTTYKWGAFQVAAKMDPVDDGLNHAYILGTYKPRATSGLTGYINAGSILWSGPLLGKVFTITSGADVGKFKVGDTVTCTPVCTVPATRTITKISADGLTVTFWVAITAATILTAISINGNDNVGLIDENNTGTGFSDAAGTIVKHDGFIYLPY